MTVHIIHGIRVDEPEESIGVIRGYFEEVGFESVVHNYGYLNSWHTRWRNAGIAERIGVEVGRDDILVGHSNGCDIARRISNAGKGCGLVLFNPALDRDTKFAPHLDWIDVYHDQEDDAVLLAWLLPWHPWGMMGRTGYRGDDPRVTNIDMTPRNQGDHSGPINNVDYWGPRAASRASLRYMGVDIRQQLAKLNVEVPAQ